MLSSIIIGEDSIVDTVSKETVVVKEDASVLDEEKKKNNEETNSISESLSIKKVKNFQMLMK